MKCRFGTTLSACAGDGRIAFVSTLLEGRQTRLGECSGWRRRNLRDSVPFWVESQTANWFGPSPATGIVQ